MSRFRGEFGYKKLCELDSYVMENYKMIKREIIGYSAVGRDIVSYTVGSTGGAIICGVFHGMERITGMMLMKFLVQLCERCLCNKQFFDQIKICGVTILPMVNPDAVQICLNGADSAGDYAENIKRMITASGLPHTRWQSNARGVDINHNFNAGWKKLRDKEIQMGYILPANTRYGGTHPESESETKAVADLCRKNNYKVGVALHTQGREIYYNYSYATPDISKKIADQMARLSGYTVSEPDSIAIGGGFKDWFIEHFLRPGFTIEAGKGVNPLSPDCFDAEYPIIEKMLWYIVDHTQKNSGEHSPPP